MKEGEFYARDWRCHPVARDDAYKTSVTRSPDFPLVSLEQSIGEMTGPVFGHSDIGTLDHDLTRNHGGDGLPLGEKIIVHGRVSDENARPVPNTLVEIWQANASGKYRHRNDRFAAPLDPNFGGCGRTLSDENGYYFFRTIRPGAYPWPNTTDSWRPAHIHFSIFGTSFSQRLITQLYFPNDPLIDLCPIVNTIKDKAAIDRLIARLDMKSAVPFDSLAYRFDIVLRGRRSTLFENRLEGN